MKFKNENEALDFLSKQNFKMSNDTIIRPSLKYLLSEDELDAIIYLINKDYKFASG